MFTVSTATSVGNTGVAPSSSTYDQMILIPYIEEEDNVAEVWIRLYDMDSSPQVDTPLLASC